MNKDELEKCKQYIEFLEKRLKSENYKNNVSKEEYAKTEAKLKKERLKLKLSTMFKK